MRKLTTRSLVHSITCAAKYILAVWIFGFIWFNGPFPAEGFWNHLLAIVWVIAFLAANFRILDQTKKRLVVAALMIAPMIGYLSIRPSHNRNWKPEFSRISFAEIDGNRIRFHNFRSFDYSENGLFEENWSEREFDLDQLVAMDFVMTHWDTEYFGHPMFSFDFGDQGHLVFTIEAKTETGESYSLLAGFYKRFELAYIPCAESDAVMVRSNFRENEYVHLYRTVATPEQARNRLLEFVTSMNRLHEKPRFYNILNSNCTTAVVEQMKGSFPWDWRIIVNGKLDELLYDRGLLVTDGLDFETLKRRVYINPKARKTSEPESFSKRIREDLPGF